MSIIITSAKIINHLNDLRVGVRELQKKSIYGKEMNEKFDLILSDGSVNDMIEKLQQLMQETVTAENLEYARKYKIKHLSSDD